MQTSGGAVLQRLLEANYLTVSELSRRSGVHRNTINNWLGSDIQPKAGMLAKVAAVFDHDEADELVGVYGYPGLMERHLHNHAIDEAASGLAGSLQADDPVTTLNQVIAMLERLRDQLSRTPLAAF